MKAHRRVLSSSVGGLAFAFAGWGASALAQAASDAQCVAIRADGRPQLLLDDYLIASAEGVEPRMLQPERSPEPVLRGDDRPDLELLPADEPGRNFWPMVVQDQETGALQAWTMIYGYRGPSDATAIGGRTLVGLAHRRLSSPLDWSGPSDVVFAADGFIHSVVDRGPDAPPERRYVAVYYDIPKPGTSFAYSPDGVSWTRDPNNPVIPALPLNDPNPAWFAGPMDIADLFHDPERGVWRLFVKVISGPGGQQSRTMDPGWGIRLTDQWESPDLVTWTNKGAAFRPQPGDEGVTEFYGAAVLAVGDLMVSFVRMLRDDAAAEADGEADGVGFTALAYSRDGVTWTRLPDIYLDRGSEPGAFDRAHAWVSSAFVEGDTLYLPYSGYGAGHKVGDRETGVAFTPKDRFVGRASAGGEPGMLTTPLLCADDDVTGLSVNADVEPAGSIDMRLLDAAGAPIPGFDYDDCADIQGDGVSLPAACARPLSEAGRSFQLQFQLTDATLYAFSLGEP